MNEAVENAAAADGLSDWEATKEAVGKDALLETVIGVAEEEAAADERL